MCPPEKRPAVFPRIAALLLLFCLLPLLLAACGREEPQSRSVSVEIGGQSALVTFPPGTLSEGTISTDRGSYTFSYAPNGQLTVTYPDGRSYTLTYRDGALAVHVDYDAAQLEQEGYLAGISLVWGIERAMDDAGGRSRSGPSPVLAFVLMALGAWNLLAPKSAWWISRGWWYRNAQPSDLALGFYRVAGVLLLAAGLICALAAL